MPVDLGTGTRWLETRVTRAQWAGRTEWARPVWVGSLGTRASFIAAKDADSKNVFMQFYRTSGTLPGGAYGTRQAIYDTEVAYNLRQTTIGTWS